MNIPTEAQQIIDQLQLQPHPKEGGFFRETYRSTDNFSLNSLPPRYQSPHQASTAIFYFFTEHHFSPLHKICTDEIFHFYAGDPIDMLHLYPDRHHEEVVFGNDVLKGERPQVIVPAGVWQGARLKSGGQWALIGCTVAPSFEYEDYEHGEAESLIKEYPHLKEQILSLAS